MLAVGLICVYTGGKAPQPLSLWL